MASTRPPSGGRDAADRLINDPPDEQAGVDENKTVELTAGELDQLRQAIADLRESNIRLENERREDRRLIEALQQGASDDIDYAALDARWRNREEARRRVWARVRGKTVVILFPKDRDPNRNFDVHLALNGKVINVPKGVPTPIPGEYLEVIDRAMVQHVTSEVDDHGNPRRVVYDYLSYPYTIISGLDGVDSGDIAAAAA